MSAVSGSAVGTGAGTHGVDGSEQALAGAKAPVYCTPATSDLETARGWFGAPGMYSDAQVEGWKKVAQAVHANQPTLRRARVERRAAR